MWISLRLSLLLLAACAHNVPSTNVPEFYGCWSMSTTDKICIAEVYQCKLNQPKVGQYKWICEKAK